eukprot:gene7476-626_t
MSELEEACDHKDRERDRDRGEETDERGNIRDKCSQCGGVHFPSIHTSCKWRPSREKKRVLPKSVWRR